MLHYTHMMTAARRLEDACEQAPIGANCTMNKRPAKTVFQHCAQAPFCQSLA